MVTAGLDDFPEHRRESLLMRYAGTYDWYDLDHIVSVSTHYSCPARPEESPRWRHLRGSRFFDPEHPLGAIRLRLRDMWGEECFVCRVNKATALDHDHLMGRVRGLLCGYCNTIVDCCVHDGHCPCGAYLNAPPAWPLDLLYPRHCETLRRAGRNGRLRTRGLIPPLPGPL